ncbi:MAG: hypothetical protein R6V61_10300 [Wenzhouxiangellaceae bacterium]
MKRVTIPALALAALWFCSATASAEDNANDRAAIVELMDKAFAAVASGDPDDWRAIQLAEGTTLSFRPDAELGELYRPYIGYFGSRLRPMKANCLPSSIA